MKANLLHSFQKWCLQSDNTFENVPSQEVLPSFFTKNGNVSFHEVENTFIDVKFIFIQKGIEMQKGSKVFVLQFGITIAPCSFGFIIY